MRQQQLDDPKFPGITYRRGGSGISRPVIRGTALHVQAIVQSLKFGETHQSVAGNYGLDIKQIQEAQAFYEAHRKEMDDFIKDEDDLEKQHIERQKKLKGKSHDKSKASS